MGNRWRDSATPRNAEDYDRHWAAMVETGKDPHGEVALVESFGPSTALDAGCGTGRVALELLRRGIVAVGVDSDESMLAAARRKGPELEWVCADLADVDLRDEAGARRRFDVVVLAGNVMIFITPGSEQAVVTNLVGHLAPAGALVAGFQLDGQLDLATYDGVCADAGLSLADRWSTWDRVAFTDGAYAVSVHRLKS